MVAAGSLILRSMRPGAPGCGRRSRRIPAPPCLQMRANWRGRARCDFGVGVMSGASARPIRRLPGDDKIDPPAAASATDQPVMPIRDGHLGTVALRHLGRIGLELVTAIETPHDEPRAGGSGVAERHRRPAIGVHRQPDRRRQLPTAVQNGGTASIRVPATTRTRPIRLYLRA